MLSIVLVMSDLIACSPVYRTEITTRCNKAETEPYFNPAECFDKIWGIVNDEFWDPNFNGIDWEDIRKRYRPRALAAKSHESFAVIVNQMLAELKTSHTRYFTKWEPDYYTLQAVFVSSNVAYLGTLETSVLEQYLSDLRSSQREPHRSGIGVVVQKIDGRYYVSAVLKSSPAEKAGILLGDWLVEADGRSFHPIRSFDNKAGQEVKLIIQCSPSEATRRLVKVIPVGKREREQFESDSRACTKIIQHKSHRFAYIRLWWLSGPAMRQVFESGLNMAEASEGMIVDIRDGFGGGPYVEYIDPFLRFGSNPIVIESIYRDHTEKSTVGFNRPVIALINSGSRSGKEMLAYCFKKWDKAVLLGQRTAGYVTGGNRKRISQDSFLYYGACMKVVDGKRLEGIGVEPDIEVPFDIRFAGGRDIQLERAKDEMVKLIKTLR